MSRQIFERLFNSDYVVYGERLSAPEDSLLVGALTVFSERKLVTLPIMKWQVNKSTTKFLCQGLEDDGKAPVYSATENQFDRLVEKIAKELPEGKWGRESK